MKRWIPAPSMVVALAALVMSTGGTVTAAALITSANIKNNTIRGVDLRDGAVRSVDVADGTLTGADTRNGSLTGVDLSDGSLTGADTRNGSLTGVDLSDGSLTGADTRNGSLTGVDLRDGSLTGADTRNGSLTGVDLRDESLTGIDVANGSLTGADVEESTLAPVPSAQTADMLDGFDASALSRAALSATSTGLTISGSEQSYGSAVSITAPAAGFVTIHGHTTIGNAECTVGCVAHVFVRHVQSNAVSNGALETPPTNGWGNISPVWVFPVEAGVNTFDFRIYRDSGNGLLQAVRGELAAHYSPFGPTGTATPAAPTTGSSSTREGN